MSTAQETAARSCDYVVPVVHVRVPQRVGNTTFWLGLTGAVIGGVVEFPLAAAIATGVVVSRHRRNELTDGPLDRRFMSADV